MDRVKKLKVRTDCHFNPFTGRTDPVCTLQLVPSITTLKLVSRAFVLVRLLRG